MGSRGTLGPALLSPAGVVLGASWSARGERPDASALREPQARFMDASYDDMWPGQRRTAGDFATPR